MAEEYVSYDKYRADLADFRADMSRYETGMSQFREEIRGDLSDMKIQFSGFDAKMSQLETRLTRLMLAGAALGGLLGGGVAALAKLL